jgi:cellulose synthase/poly-beta-1,6-N-acetylglucosamine synthase-like glycosyltransferase
MSNINGETILLILYSLVMVVVCTYGLHRYFLVYLYFRHRRRQPQLTSCFRELPKVTVQLPMYNEKYVARRIVEYACRIDYPRDRLEIQVLDDSTDETQEIALRAVERKRAEGYNIVYLHRDNREGFKAGALEAGLKRTDSEFICIFDADFLPPPGILKDTIHYFQDPAIGIVQSRWDHINREHSLLTKTQAVLLDGHFIIEHIARNRSGRFMSFNGTAGLWRRRCIEDAGGWHHDTLTEDLDLSYRAQMRGWRFVYLPQLASPAELPSEMNSFRAQQHRWTKGGAQTFKKVFPNVLRSRLPLKVKVEAFFHLTYCIVYFFIMAMTLMLFPVLYVRGNNLTTNQGLWMLVDLSLFVLATCSASTFYICSQRELFRTWADSIKYLPFLMSLGIGISLSNSIAAFEGLIGRQSDFVRTPKFGVTQTPDDRWKQRASAYRPKKKWWRMPALELAVGGYMLACMVYCLANANFMALPFLALFMIGFLYVGLTSIFAHLASLREPVAEPDDQPLRAAQVLPQLPPSHLREP